MADPVIREDLYDSALSGGEFSDDSSMYDTDASVEGGAARRTGGRQGRAPARRSRSASRGSSRSRSSSRKAPRKASRKSSHSASRKGSRKGSRGASRKRARAYSSLRGGATSSKRRRAAPKGGEYFQRKIQSGTARVYKSQTGSKKSHHLSSGAKEALGESMHQFALALSKNLADLMQSSTRKTVSEDDVKRSAQSVFTNVESGRKFARDLKITAAPRRTSKGASKRANPAGSPFSDNFCKRFIAFHVPNARVAAAAASCLRCVLTDIAKRFCRAAHKSFEIAAGNTESARKTLASSDVAAAAAAIRCVPALCLPHRTAGMHLQPVAAKKGLERQAERDAEKLRSEVENTFCK